MRNTILLHVEDFSSVTFLYPKRPPLKQCVSLSSSDKGQSQNSETMKNTMSDLWYKRTHTAKQYHCQVYRNKNIHVLLDALKVAFWTHHSLRVRITFARFILKEEVNYIPLYLLYNLTKMLNSLALQLLPLITESTELQLFDEFSYCIQYSLPC